VRLTTLERDAARLNGERAQYVASRAQAKGKITRRAADHSGRQGLVSEVSKDLRETNDKIGEFVERKVTRRSVAAGRYPRAAGRHGAAIHGAYKNKRSRKKKKKKKKKKKNKK